MSYDGPIIRCTQTPQDINCDDKAGVELSELEHKESSESLTNIDTDSEEDIEDISATEFKGCDSNAIDLGEKHIGPTQPHLNKYPSMKSGKQNRSFNEDWFNKFPWIEYSIQHDAIFCFPCRHFHSPSAYADNLFTLRGFRNWKSALGKCGKVVKHAESGSHTDAMVQWEHYRLSRVTGSVIVQQSSVIRAWIDGNRLYVRRIIDAILYLTQQGLALRGDDESIDSLNRGNFLELLALLSAVDQEFGQLRSRMPGNATYTSAEIQNELICVLASTVRASICHDANEAGFISIMVDESKDVSRKEQMSLCVRYTALPNCDVREEFLTFRHMTDVDAEALCAEIVTTMRTLGLQCIVIAQCYDGASVMSGNVTGVQTRFREIHKSAVYIHCHAHRLNLVIVDVAREVQSAGEFFSMVELLYVFLTRQKVHEVFVRIQKERGLVVRELGRLSDTRWACRHQSISVIDERYGEIIVALKEISKLCGYSNSEIRTLALGLLCDLQGYSFVANLVIFSQILSLSHGVNEALQSSTMNIAQCDKSITGLMKSIADLREKESSWNETWLAIETKCNSHGIKLPENKRKRTIVEFPDMLYTSSTGHRVDASTDVCKSLRVDLFYPVLDRIDSEFKRRFSTDALSVMRSLACMLSPNSPQFLVYDTIKPMLSVYGESCGINASLLKAEMSVALNLIKESLGDKLSTCEDVQVVLQLLSPSLAFPNLRKCIQIALTVPVTSASCERSFSAMKLLKTYLRNKTEDDRLSDLATLFVHKLRARSLDRDNIIDVFAEKVDRRLQLV